MPNLQEILAKRKSVGGEAAIEFLIAKKAQESADKIMGELRKEIVSNVTEEVKSEILKLTGVVKKGDKGEKGDSIVGPQGPQGPKGDKPIAGVDYPVPKNGKDARIPVAGVDFPMPKDGEKGEKGDPGSPDTPEQIVNKLNTTEDKVELKVIKGLPRLLENLRHAIREKSMGGQSGGGGMGMPVSQSFACNGILTSFTLPNNVSANGKAIWVFYQGQWLAPTTHYTVSGKTLNLTFTPGSGTSIDVLFIRT